MNPTCYALAQEQKQSRHAKRSTIPFIGQKSTTWCELTYTCTDLRILRRSGELSPAPSSESLPQYCRTCARIQSASNPAILRVTRSTQTWIQLFPSVPIDRFCARPRSQAAFIRWYNKHLCHHRGGKHCVRTCRMKDVNREPRSNSHRRRIAPACRIVQRATDGATWPRIGQCA